MTRGACNPQSNHCEKKLTQFTKNQQRNLNSPLENISITQKKVVKGEQRKETDGRHAESKQQN